MQVEQITRLRAEVGTHLAQIRGREAEKSSSLAEVQVRLNAKDTVHTVTNVSAHNMSLRMLPTADCVATQGLKEAMSMRKAEQEREQ